MQTSLEILFAELHSTDQYKNSLEDRLAKELVKISFQEMKVTGFLNLPFSKQKMGIEIAFAICKETNLPLCVNFLPQKNQKKAKNEFKCLSDSFWIKAKIQLYELLKNHKAKIKR